MSSSDDHFERPLSADELLPARLRDHLINLLAPLSAQPPTFSTSPIAGAAAVHYELEPLLWVHHPDASLAAVAAGFLEQICVANGRYLQASALHHEVVRHDFEQLQRQYAALETSEQRYRALAGELEQRVAAQINEIDTTRRHLYASEKLAAVGQLAAGLAHEINNPMSYVLNNCKIAQDYLGSVAAFRENIGGGDSLEHWQRYDLDAILADFKALLDESVEGSRRVVELVQELRQFADIDYGETREVKINSLIRTAARMVAAQTRGCHDITLELASGLKPIRARAGDVSQAVFNVIINATQACARQGQVTVRSRAAPGGCEIIVDDNGHGMDASVLARVFEPFFTTRGLAEGTGLGLTLAREKIRQHGGDIALTSDPGVGTRAVLYLPTDAAR